MGNPPSPWNFVLMLLFIFMPEKGDIASKENHVFEEWFWILETNSFHFLTSLLLLFHFFTFLFLWSNFFLLFSLSGEAGTGQPSPCNQWVADEDHNDNHDDYDDHDDHDEFLHDNDDDDLDNEYVDHNDNYDGHDQYNYGDDGDEGDDGGGDGGGDASGGDGNGGAEFHVSCLVMLSCHSLKWVPNIWELRQVKNFSNIFQKISN